MYRIFEFLIEGWGWIKIVTGHIFLALILPFVFYSLYPYPLVVVSGSVVLLVMVCIGVRTANRAWKGHGTMAYFTGLYAVTGAGNAHHVISSVAHWPSSGRTGANDRYERPEAQRTCFKEGEVTSKLHRTT